jgi:rubrerythrin
MALIDGIRAGWRRWLSFPQLDNQQRLIDMLCQEYLNEVRDVFQFTEHAQRMVYPHVRERLLRIAEEEQAHVTWLAEQIRALGGEPPTAVLPVTPAKNLWQYLRMDEDEEKQDASRFAQRINALEADHPALAEKLRRIRSTERRHRLELLDIAAKTNPAGLPVVMADQSALEQQKRVWLEQQKLEWFEQRHAEWEAGGKLTPWAEWVAERETQWRVTELPNRELRWRLYVAEQGLEKPAS